jgi:hypothetical protein
MLQVQRNFGSGNEGGCGLIVQVARLERYNKGFTSMGCVFRTRGSRRDLCGSEAPVRRVCRAGGEGAASQQTER